jgi:hypothetical protein
MMSNQGRLSAALVINMAKLAILITYFSIVKLNQIL